MKTVEPEGASERDAENDLQKFNRSADGKASRPQHSYTSLIGLPPAETSQLLKRLGEGLEYHRLERLGRNSGLSISQLADLLHIPPRTLTRRKEKGRLLPDESDRLLRITRVFAKALELFEGDVMGARHWLSTPQPALGGETPLEFTKTDIGSREVENLIGRLEHGVFT